MSLSPAAARSIGNQSSAENMPFSTVPALTLPGQRMIAGARKPPSMTVPFVPLKGVMPPSGQVNTSAPLSVVKMTIVLSASPESSTHFSRAPTPASGKGAERPDRRYCTPGFVNAAHVLVESLAREPVPKTEVEARILAAMDGHICRCTGYVRYYAALRDLIFADPKLTR
jgi:hypothetical protein